MVIKIVFLGYYLDENLCLAIYGPVQVLCSALLVEAILLVFSQLIVLHFCNTAKMYKDQFMWLTLIQLLNTLVIQF